MKKTRCWTVCWVVRLAMAVSLQHVRDWRRWFSTTCPACVSPCSSSLTTSSRPSHSGWSWAKTEPGLSSAWKWFQFCSPPDLLCCSQAPLASWLSMLISCLAGSLLSNLLLGFPLAEAFRSDWKVLSILIVWVSVYFSPQVRLAHLTLISLQLGQLHFSGLCLQVCEPAAYVRPPLEYQGGGEDEEDREGGGHGPGQVPGQCLPLAPHRSSPG